MSWLKRCTEENWPVSDPSEQPTDTVSSISWSKNSTVPTVATGSWDSYVRIYQVDSEELLLRQTVNFDAQTSCLGIDWHEDSSQLFAGCTSGNIKGFDLSKKEAFEIGSHTEPVKDVHWVAEMNILCSVSFDKTVKLWDLRQSDPVYQSELRYKPMYSDLHGSKLALASSGSQIAIIDLVEALETQGSQERLQYIKAPFKDPISCIKFLPDGEKLAFGTAGGITNISKVKITDSQGIIFNSVLTLKTQKVDADKSSNTTNRMYPVNSLLVNSKQPSRFLGTCGGEGKVFYLDFDAQSKCIDFQMKDLVTCGKMSWDGNWLAFATGNDWSRGISEYKTKGCEVYVRRVLDGELMDFSTFIKMKNGL